MPLQHQQHVSDGTSEQRRAPVLFALLERLLTHCRSKEHQESSDAKSEHPSATMCLKAGTCPSGLCESGKTFRFKEKPPDALEAENFRQMSTEHLLSEVFEVRMKEWGKLLQKNVKK
ncbi:hypothetical protein F2P81_020262 [Scophthalmus maximus]|uniref:Uncharacterized protein n=1 Tax=Scophthalmus maximus TaxID=52904 RepID=A0A6A4S8V0_SCOMX|nr:hypothetical protein F2P81_020262 [Scophthalmus maximus]